ncbi:MAG: hypothetical protein JKY56_10480 [Kofleriaceae bacterium]|nr:hypothetical protein [Kofleriaceae bacterium]
MKLFRAFSIAAVIGVVSALLPSHASADSYKGEIYPLSKVKRGQKGYGLTTMKGTTPERFTFEVIGVNRNFLPKMDIILVKSDDPKVQITGFWQGMSGSPLYIEGKLVCAFSYGFRFNKQAIGGCTPLEYMKEEGLRKRRGSPLVHKRNGSVKGTKVSRASGAAPRSAASLAQWLKVVPDGDIGRSMARGARKAPWLLASTLPKRSQTADLERGMQASAVPLALSGFSPPAFAEAKRAMSGFPLEPMQAGGTGSPNQGPTEFQMGGSIAVQLIRGDMSAAATGTVSYISGKDVLAFGHPMFKAGEIYAPVAAAEVHVVIPSAQSAFVVASPLRELGSLTQDRQSTIAADTSLKIDMIPMHIRIRSGAGKTIGTFDVEILDNRFFTATFASIAAGNATSLYLPDRDHVTVRIKSTVRMKGHKPLVFHDFLHSSRGAASVVGGARGLRVLSPLLSNPFEKIDIQSIDVDVEVAYDTNTVDIIGVAAPTAALKPGKRNYVNVTLQPHRGKPFVKKIPFDVPASLAGSIVRLEVICGDSAGLHIAPPKSVDDLLAAFGSLLPGTVYAVTLYSAEEGAAINGRLIHDLPASALNRLRSSTRAPRVTTSRAQSRSLSPAKHVVEGSASVFIKVGNL